MAAKKTAKKAAKKTSKKSAKKAPKKAAKKAAKAKKVAAKKADKKVAAEKKEVRQPTHEEITRAAFLNYRRRMEQGLPGDSRSDWLEAEKQLRG